MDTDALIQSLREEIDQLSQESMQVRAQMEATLQQYNLKLGEYNGQMKAREAFIARLEATNQEKESPSS